MGLSYQEAAPNLAPNAPCARALGLSSTPPGLELRPADPERVRSLAKVKKPETLDHARGLPVPGGLFDPAIFGDALGPLPDQPPLDPSASPAGCLPLAMPLVHPLFASRCSDLLADLAKLSAEATSAALAFEDLEHRLALLRGLEASPLGRTFIINELPILPAPLRPMVALPDGRWATHGVNALYRAVLNRNLRLARLLDLNAPEVVLNNEARVLHESLLTLMTGQPSTLDEGDQTSRMPLAELLPQGLEAALATLDLRTPARKQTFLVVSVLGALGFEARAT
jgi:DNA-directed RNA polymerase beta' subunit